MSFGRTVIYSNYVGKDGVQHKWSAYGDIKNLPDCAANQWYRIWSDNWVEQGGLKFKIANNSNYSQTLPITMVDSRYTVTIAQCASNDSDFPGFYFNQGCVLARTPTTVTLSNRRFAGDGTYYIDIMWQASGMAA